MNRRVVLIIRYYSISLILFGLLFLIAGCARPEISFNDYTNIDTTYPEQVDLDVPEIFIVERGRDVFTIYPQAKYRVGAVVRSKRAYRTDRLSKISPYDLALVWGVLADEHFYRQIRITQGGRRYFFKLKKDAQLSVDWVYLNSSNHHLIPANDNVRRALRKVRRNDTIELDGYLVNVYAQVRGNSFNWNTSLTRTDRGDGSCEIMYVERIKINYRVYE